MLWMTCWVVLDRPRDLRLFGVQLNRIFRPCLKCVESKTLLSNKSALSWYCVIYMIVILGENLR
jgi:hypothetical protein